MPGPLTARWLAAIGFAVITTASGCGAEVTSGQATTEPSSATEAGADVYEQLEAAREPITCSPVFAAVLSTAFTADHLAMRTSAQKYTELVATWDEQVGDIEFPTAAEPLVDRIRELNATEIDDLDAMVGLADNAEPLALVDQANLVNFDELSVVVAVDDLAAELGHPRSEPTVAGDALELAYATFYKDIAGVWPKFSEALKNNDLEGAKAANAIEEQAAQRFIDALGGIAWPAGYDERVAALRDGLQGLIEFDRRQVDVPTAADIVPTPPEGAAESQKFEAAKVALVVSLKADAMKAGDVPQC